MKIYHHNDADGRSAANIIYQKYPNLNREDFIELDYENPIPTGMLTKDELVLILDYSFTNNTRDQFESIIKITKNVQWIDHHVSSTNFCLRNKDLVNNIIELVLNADKCGALLTYNHYFYNSETPKYLMLIDDWDRFQLKFKESELLKLYLESVDCHPCDDVWEKLKSDEFLNECIEKGRCIKNYLSYINEEDAMALAYEITINGNKCICINKKGKKGNSTLLGSLFKQYPLGMIWSYNGKEYVHSIYSYQNQIDCSKIAEHFGGGGHKGAAGFKTDQLLFTKNSYVNLLYDGKL